MDGYKDAHTHIHPSASATKAFMNALEFHGPWDGTIEQALPVMDKAGIATTIEDGVARAAQSIDSGHAYERLEALRLRTKFA